MHILSVICSVLCCLNIFYIIDTYTFLNFIMESLITELALVVGHMLLCIKNNKIRTLIIYIDF